MSSWEKPLKGAFSFVVKNKSQKIFGNTKYVIYFYGQIKKSMTKEKRNTHTYKCSDKRYSDAMKRAKKEGGALAVHIEHWVAAYSEGLEININYKQPKK